MQPNNQISQEKAILVAVSRTNISKNIIHQQLDELVDEVFDKAEEQRLFFSLYYLLNNRSNTHNIIYSYRKIDIQLYQKNEANR